MQVDGDSSNPGSDTSSETSNDPRSIMPGSKSPKARLFSGEEATIAVTPDERHAETPFPKAEAGRQVIMVGPKSDAGAVGNAIKEWMADGPNHASPTAATPQSSGSSPAQNPRPANTQVQP